MANQNLIRHLVVMVSPLNKTRSKPIRRRSPSPLKAALFVDGVRYWPLARAVNIELPPEEQLSERAISQLAIDKRIPTRAQAEAISRVLRRPVEKLFPELS